MNNSFANFRAPRFGKSRRSLRCIASPGGSLGTSRNAVAFKHSFPVHFMRYIPVAVPANCKFVGVTSSSTDVVPLWPAAA